MIREGALPGAPAGLEAAKEGCTRGVSPRSHPRGGQRRHIRRVSPQTSTWGAQRKNIHVGCHIRPTSERGRAGMYIWGVTSHLTATPSAPAGSATSGAERPARPSRPTRPRTTFPSNPAGARPSPALPLSAAWHHGLCSVPLARRSLPHIGLWRRTKLSLPSAPAAPRVRRRRGSARGRGAAGTEAAEGR